MLSWYCLVGLNCMHWQGDAMRRWSELGWLRSLIILVPRLINIWSKCSRSVYFGGKRLIIWRELTLARKCDWLTKYKSWLNQSRRVQIGLYLSMWVVKCHFCWGLPHEGNYNCNNLNIGNTQKHLSSLYAFIGYVFILTYLGSQLIMFWVAQ